MLFEQIYPHCQSGFRVNVPPASPHDRVDEAKTFASVVGRLTQQRTSRGTVWCRCRQPAFGQGRAKSSGVNSRHAAGWASSSRSAITRMRPYPSRKVSMVRTSPAPGSSQKWVSSVAIVITHSTALLWRTRPNATHRRLASTCGLTSTVSMGGQAAALSGVSTGFLHTRCSLSIGPFMGVSVARRWPTPGVNPDRSHQSTRCFSSVSR